MNKQTLDETDDWNKFSHLFKREDIPARTILLREGTVAKNAYLIEKGCLRTWFNNDGSDITTQFFFEGNSVSSIESFRTGQPSLISIESIEPCTIQIIAKKDFEYILEQSPEIRNVLETHIFKRLVHCQKLLLSHIKDSPQKRYEDIMEQQPDMIKRIPQHYIASYLGITKVHLSRIKGKLARQK